MTYARLTHSTRPTLEFRQLQQDEDSQEAVTDIAAEIGDDRPPLVHVRGRNRDRSLTGLVSGSRRARDDDSTADWQQAIANYILELEAHCDEFQGLGYTFQDDIRGESISVCYDSLEWTLRQGQPFDVEFDIGLSVGRGTLDSRGVDVSEATIREDLDVAARVDGIDLPGLREFSLSHSWETDVRSIYNRDTAESNDIVAEEGVQRIWTFEGTHTGTETERSNADAALDSLLGTGLVDFETRFPGYTVEGKVLSYNSDFRAQYGESYHQFALTFIEARE